MVAGFTAGATYWHIMGEPTFSETLGFDHQGQLELSALGIYFSVGLALILGTPIGCWIALRIGGHDRRPLTAIVAALIATLCGFIALGQVPSGPRDPVLEPYVLVASALLAGALARLITASTPTTTLD